LQLVSLSRTLSAPIGEVWAVTSSFGTIQAWMRHVTRVAIRGAGVKCGSHSDDASSVAGRARFHRYIDRYVNSTHYLSSRRRRLCR